MEVPGLDALGNLLRNRESARVVGREYLRRVPKEADASILVALLGASHAVASAKEPSLRQEIRDRIRRDFDDGRTVQLRGWVLSVTEARLSALSLFLG